MLPFLFALALLLPAAAPAAAETAVTYPTVNGPRTLDQMATELAAVGYPGPWDEVSVWQAYVGTATAPAAHQDAQPSPAPTVLRCREFCFMVPSGKGVDTLVSLAGMSHFSPLALWRLANSGDILRVEANTRVEYVADGPVGPYIRPLSGKHQGQLGQTLWDMVATLP
jgi:hypothetical protein